MIQAPQTTGTDGDVPYLHNVSIDEPIAVAGRCGTIHLPSGRVCRAQAHHAGGCDFGPPS